MISVNEIKEDNYSHLGRNTIIKGEITLAGDTHINALLEGTITHTTGENLTLEYHSQVKGTLHGHNLTIMGEFTGDIICDGKVTIYPTARVKGTIECEQLIVQPGAHLEITGKTLNAPN